MSQGPTTEIHYLDRVEPRLIALNTAQQEAVRVARERHEEFLATHIENINRRFDREREKITAVNTGA